MWCLQSQDTRTWFGSREITNIGLLSMGSLSTDLLYAGTMFAWGVDMLVRKKERGGLVFQSPIDIE
jgi:hypothetical protein